MVSGFDASHLDYQLHPAWYHVGHVGAYAQITYCANSTLLLADDLLGVYHELGGGDEPILAQGHGRGACVVDLARDYHEETTDAGNTCHSSQGNALLFQHRPLLDVYLQVGGDTARLTDLGRYVVWASSQLEQRSFEGLAGLVRLGQHFRCQVVGHAPAAHCGYAKVSRFLAKKVHDLQWVAQLKAQFLQAAGDLQAGDDAYSAVEPPAT